jgi:hypothetical protein
MHIETRDIFYRAVNELRCIFFVMRAEKYVSGTYISKIYKMLCKNFISEFGEKTGAKFFFACVHFHSLLFASDCLAAS